MSELPRTTTLPSGAVLSLKIAPFSSSSRLLKAIALEAKGVALGFKIELGIGDPKVMLAKLATQDLPVDLIKDALCQIIASEAVESALNDCLSRCLYAGQAITRDSFEPERARQDYFPATWEVMKLNLSPFFAGLASMSSTPSGGS